MGLILRTGLGTKKLAIVIPVGKNTFKTLKEEGMYGGIVKVEKTDSHPVNNQWLIEQYRFGYYNGNGLDSYLLGNVLGSTDFYLKEGRNTKVASIRDNSLKVISGKAKIRWANIFGMQRKSNGDTKPFFSKGVYFLMDYAKNYLRDNGIERIVVQAE
ncbi:MAG: hypothetical protein WD876_03370, partial [Candidatus Pacearchaeota archaeon]